MFDGFLKSRFYTKCKFTIKNTKTRLETVRKKKNAVYKYLKEDIADLLRCGHDYNAYGRMEGFLEEKKRLNCYNLLEQFSVCVSSNLSLLSKQRDCPEDCREAVSSLIYAAARVSEIPELRDLRAVFAERYGNSLDPFVNQEFAETFETRSGSREMKIQLMREIAQEFSIKWDSKALEQKLLRQPSTLQSETKYQFPSDADDDRCKKQMNKNNVFESRDSQVKGSGSDDDPYKRQKFKKSGFESLETKDPRKEFNTIAKSKGNETDDGDLFIRPTIKKNDFKDIESKDARNKYNVEKEKGSELKFHGKKGITDDKNYKPYKYSSSEDESTSITRRESTDRDSLWTSSLSSAGSVSEDEMDISIRKKPLSYKFIPPPYTKPTVEKKEKAQEKTEKPNPQAVEAKIKPRSVRQRFLKPMPGRDDEVNAENETRNGLEEKNNGLKTNLGFNLKPPPSRQCSETAAQKQVMKFDPIVPQEEVKRNEDRMRRNGRATSFQMEMKHYKLPDYDELAARIAALNGR